MTIISPERIAQIAARRDELQALTAIVELPSSRHPGLEPGSHFFGAGQGSGTPGQAQGDGMRGGDDTFPPKRIAQIVARQCQILPGTGRWQREALTEGGCLGSCALWPAPSTVLWTVPLPVPGRI